MRRKQLLRIMIGILAIITVASVLATTAAAQVKFKTLHKFTGGKDGSSPVAALVADAANNLYGTTIGGGAHGWGNVFELTPNSKGGWTERVLHQFSGGKDGARPGAALIFDAAGVLYGTTVGGGAYAKGTVFVLTPGANGAWTEKVLHSFNADGVDGIAPYGSLAIDTNGNLYGTSYEGGVYGFGTVFQMTPIGGGKWTETVLYSFTGGVDGSLPEAGVILDSAGCLYGTAAMGAYGHGLVFKLTPGQGGGWTESVLYNFTGDKDGRGPLASLVFDGSGNLYGTTYLGGGGPCVYGCGVVFKLAPSSGGGWTETVPHSFAGGKAGRMPLAPVVFDRAGNLYGTTFVGGGGGALCYYSPDNAHGCGVVFMLTPTSSGWDYTVLKTFNDKSGAMPQAGLVSDSVGNFYGTTAGDGSTTFGTVYEITP